MDHGLKRLETSLGGLVLGLSCLARGKGGKGEGGKGEGGKGVVRANADSVSQGTVKTALDSGKEIFGIFCSIPTPMGTSPIDKGCIWGQGNPLRTVRPRLRLQ